MATLETSPNAESALRGGLALPEPDPNPRAEALQVSDGRMALAYLLLVAVPILGLLGILWAGASLPGPHAMAERAVDTTIPSSSVVLRLPLLLLQIVVIVVVSRVLGIALSRFGQPRVVGEMMAGLMLGPSVLGLCFPDAYAWLFPGGTVRFLSALSQIGLVVFMFLVGLELDLRAIASQGRRALVASHASIAIPMLAGGGLAWVLYRDFSTQGTSFMAFALFIGCAFSMTAFSVLARILRERQWADTTLGSMAMACAAMADLCAWVLLALVLALGRGNTSELIPTLARSLLGFALYLLFMFVVVRRVLEALWARHRKRKGSMGLALDQDVVSGFVIMLLVSALATEWIHIHALLGAFVAGIAMPRDRELAAALRLRFEDLLLVLLLPLFFAYAGLRTNIGMLSTGHAWSLCLGVILVATIGKVAGGALGARMTGSTWREAGSLGVLMNARGTMELVLLTIGLQLGVITPALFTMMVIMTIVTTAATSPMLAAIQAWRDRGARDAPPIAA